MKNKLLILFLFLRVTTYSQELEPGVVRAVIVGISDYQSEAISDLKYAHRDAMAFAAWLASPGGGNVPEENMQVLLNEEATMAQFARALDWLLVHSKADDQAIIYFSGHGDVEYKTRTQTGFLLCYDSPGQIYMAGGAFGIPYLKEIINTLSIDTKAKVLLITDACRSGKLAGSAVEGPRLTNANLAQQFSSEIKILSCQPNEYSVEGEQWGGGRGVFSYHLVNGLTGLADKDKDLEVTLMEVGRYLEDEVPKDVAPIRQMPMIVGDRYERLCLVDELLLKQLQSDQNEVTTEFSSIDTRRWVDMALLDGDSSIAEKLQAFEKAIAENRFFEPRDDCADVFFQWLMEEPSLSELHPVLKRNYAAALQDDAQQAINGILQVNVRELTQSATEKIEAYQGFPRLLARSAELLGEKHYLYPSLKSRQVLFEGLLQYCATMSGSGPEPQKAASVITKYREALRWQPTSPVTHFYMNICFANKMQEPDSALVHAREATRYARSWVLPYVYLSYYLSRRYGRFEDARILLDSALAIDSNNVFVWKSMGAMFFYQGKGNEAVAAFERAAAIDPLDAQAWLNLGVIHIRKGNYEQAKTALQQSLRADTSQYLAYLYSGELYVRTKEAGLAEKMYLKSIDFSPLFARARMDLANLYLRQGREEEAEMQYLEVVKHTTNNTAAWYNLACLTAKSGRHDEALEYLEKAIQNGFKNEKHIKEDPDLESVRGKNEFQDIMNKYFQSIGN